MIAEEFSNFVINLREKDIPERVKEKAKDHILDIFGLMIAVSEFRAKFKPLMNMISSLEGLKRAR